MSHAYECEPGFGVYYLYVFQRIHRQTDIFDLYDFPTEVEGNQSVEALLENYCRTFPQLSLPSHDQNVFKNHLAYHEYVEQYCHLELHERMQLLGLIAIVFSFFMRQGTPRAEVTDPRVAELVSYVQQHLTEPISIETLADRACLTKSYLIRMFRDKLGMTPLQYILQKKIQKAQTMLLGTDLSITEVAHAVGFHDASYFIRLFHKNLGFTPQEYRTKLIG
jgi:AraC-like DNA-binding protein